MNDDSVPNEHDRHGAANYTLGQAPPAMAVMSGRRLADHGWFLVPHLRPADVVLDVGCGPGSMTVDIAHAVRPGRVMGVDVDPRPLSVARELARQRGLDNVSFHEASCEDLPIADASVDRVFCHALLEHVRDPAAALTEFRRVLRPAGVLAVASPDWRACVATPPSKDLEHALATVVEHQFAQGGDPFVGRRLGVLAEAAGFGDLDIAARFQYARERMGVAHMLAEALETSGHRPEADVVRRWADHPAAAMFAEAWVSVVGVR